MGVHPSKLSLIFAFLSLKSKPFRRFLVSKDGYLEILLPAGISALILIRSLNINLLLR